MRRLSSMPALPRGPRFAEQNRITRAILLAVLLLLSWTTFVRKAAMAQGQSQPTGVPKDPKVLRYFPLTKFYDTPDPLPPGKPGDVIRSTEFEEYNLPPGVSVVRVLYHSRSRHGDDVAASGVVLFPEDEAPPAGGWPVIAWAHPWVGVARDCAPSLARNLQHGPILSMYVHLGYAVVAADYTGLGTNFRSAFADIPSNSLDVIYSIAAARHAVPQLGSRWIVVGMGEGGVAALGVAEREQSIGDPNYLGSIAISGLADLQDVYERASSLSYRLPLFLAYGIQTVDPEFKAGEMLTDKALPLYRQIGQACSATESAASSATEILKTNWERNQFVQKYFSRSRLGMKPASVPLLVISSETKPAVSETTRVVARLCKQGDRVQFEKYPEDDPGRVIGDSVGDQIAWIQARFAGRPIRNNCPAQP